MANLQLLVLKYHALCLAGPACLKDVGLLGLHETTVYFAGWSQKDSEDDQSLLATPVIVSGSVDSNSAIPGELRIRHGASKRCSDRSHITITANRREKPMKRRSASKIRICVMFYRFDNLMVHYNKRSLPPAFEYPYTSRHIISHNNDPSFRS